MKMHCSDKNILAAIFKRSIRSAFAVLMAGLGVTSVVAVPAWAGDPKVPAARDPGGVYVALFDTGINYTLAKVAKRLARDGEGELIGYDYHDDDQTPFDALPLGKNSSSHSGETAVSVERKHPALQRSGIRHGTMVASVILSEAPNVALVPLRFKAGDPLTFARMAGFASQVGAQIVAMALGGRKRAQWEPFAKAAAHFKDLLFVVSAGNNGRNLDTYTLYPAQFRLPNVIVVTSTYRNGSFPRSSNWSAKLVDISTPAEMINAYGFDGKETRASGTSFAASRITALAARIHAANPKLRGADLKAAIIARAVANPSTRTKLTRHGWIKNPAGPL